MTLKEYVVSHIVNLIKIKSVVTLALTATFVVLALRGDIEADQFLMIFTTVTAFYFGTQKKDETKETSTSTAETSTSVGETSTIPAIGEIQYDAVYPSGESDAVQG